MMIKKTMMTLMSMTIMIMEIVQFRKQKKNEIKKNTLIMCKYVFNADSVADDNDDGGALD